MIDASAAFDINKVAETILVVLGALGLKGGVDHIRNARKQRRTASDADSDQLFCPVPNSGSSLTSITQEIERLRQAQQSLRTELQDLKMSNAVNKANSDAFQREVRESIQRVEEKLDTYDSKVDDISNHLVDIRVAMGLGRRTSDVKAT